MTIVKVEPILRNTVVFTVVTAGYVPFALNLQASLQRIGLGDQLLIYTPDSDVDRELSAMGIRCRYFEHQKVDEWSDYATPGFAAIAAAKFVVACEILNTGSNALFVDSDIVFLANPAEYLQDIIDKSLAHLVMQFESPKAVYNTGFWYARPDPLVLSLFRDIQDSLLVDKTFICDQACFNELVPDRPQIKIHALDVRLFACGNQFIKLDPQDDNRVDLAANPFPLESAYLLHFNYIIGKREKVLAIKRLNMVFYPNLLKGFNEKSSLWSVAGRGRTKIVDLGKRWGRGKQKVLTAIRGEPIHRWPRALMKLW